MKRASWDSLLRKRWGRVQGVPAMTGPCSTAGSPAQATGERRTCQMRGGGFTAREVLGIFEPSR
jgi:hypothetical protein